MKKVIMGAVLLASLLLILSACGNGKQDKMQGEWKASNVLAQDYIGKKMEINDDNVKVKEKGNEGTDIKYFTLEDNGDEEKEIAKFYTSKPKDEDFDKKKSVLEGKVKFENDDKNLIIDTETGMKFEFEKI